ncbi:fat-like cadherin-related tumor suppressor homolog isoform X2 [Musca domestica]|uniref:Fat-like cadherin-related tumor suppressor homolog isoform X2 n=2 Tax=Musca domestica TaxID=7370 RepID=A0ABM3VHA9_MUSDO|nr:fat-like cadherin-related tumor suppressor homolog isoform X2 [Musca domestica]
MKFKHNVYMLTCTYTVVLHLIVIFWTVTQVCYADNLEPESLSRKVHNIYSIEFKKKEYNVTIPENSIGKTYATPKSYDERIGLDTPMSCNAVFRIISGDRDKLFKAEERTVGNFAFLSIRTRTSNVVLNREKNEVYNFRVKAFVTCPANGSNILHEAECTINLQVLDRNDLNPLFYPTEYSVTIFEDVPVHSSILKVTAEDADLGINGEIYYSFLNSSPYFIIHPSSGVISNVRPLINLGGRELEIIVIAIDRGSAMLHHNHQSSKAKVLINVEKTNLHSPDVYVTTVSSIVIHETTDANRNIYGIIRVSDKDSGRHGDINDVSIVNGDADGIFEITQAKTREEYYIQLKKLVVLANTTNTFNITIRVEDNGIPKRHTSKNVLFTIYTDKQNAPVFTKPLYEVSIPETAPINMPVIRLKVSDPSFGKNALVFLEVVGGNEGGEFKINPDTGMLYTQKYLDAEKTAFYTLTVSAIDQANLGVRKQSSAKVKINVLDVNDNDPIFEQKNITVYINENEKAGTYVTKVLARDKDSGENSYISYSITNLYDMPFDIDHFSGVIRTTTLIDFEVMRRSYQLKVRASDWGLPYRRQTEMEVFVNINDINDNRPQFERVDCLGKVFRQAPIGTDIFTLSAIDFDVGDYITYRLISGNEDGCFNMDSITGVITIGCDLNDIPVSHRYINVSATDGTHFSDEMMIKIDLLRIEHSDALKNGYSSFECHETGVAKKLADILAASEKNNMKTNNEIESNGYFTLTNRYGQNVHKPEFIDFPLTLNVNESLPLGETITRFRAKDRDLGYNGKLVFGISDGDFESVFRVDPDSGELQLIGYLDRERQEDYVLNITVRDLGQPPKSDSKMLSVNILDVNDNPPIFQKPIIRLHLPENTKNESQVFCLNATDADATVNAQISYGIKSDTRNFAINSTTGCLFLINLLDREKQNEYELQIFAKDGGVPSLSAEALVSIIVDDVNDNAPVFGIQEIIFKVREDLPRGTVVAKVEANDFDIGINSEILFSIKDDTTNSSTFKIDKYSGIIMTQNYLDYEKQQIYNLVVTAVDCGTPSLSSDMPVVIEIIDVNENRYAPEFDDYVYIGKIKENEPKGSIVRSVTAKDLDTKGPESDISYYIRGGDGMGIFSITDKGSIRTLSHLDAESKNFYWLTVCAQDQAVVPLFSCTQVFIEVEDVNDNVPLTSQPVYYPHIFEGSNAHTLIIRLNATDDDINKLTKISYKIVSGNPEGFFEINKETGELMTTERKLDRENQVEHILEVRISDNGFPSLYSTTRVVVSVKDINDNSPQFEQRFYKIQIPSTSDINVPIFQILATDIDIGENGRISYNIKSGKGKNKFRIDADTGLIYATKPLEMESEYELIIKAEDHGSPKKSQTARLNVLVIPILEQSKAPPSIKTTNSLVEVTESDKAGFLVTLIQASDEDSEHLWYNISGGNENHAFFIGHDNGNVLLSKSLDWETKNFYNLTITVSDGSNIVNTQLFIKVVDTNDNRPQFTKDVYHVNISEGIKEETIVLQLHAFDKDEDKKIFYTLHGSKDPSSLEFFRIDSVTGNVVVSQKLDYEKNKRHELIVIAKDQGTPAKRNYAKIIVDIYDHNDHSPEFTSKMLQSKIPESAAVGSKVIQVSATDRDSGKNGEIFYSIISGNVGNIFEIDKIVGTVYISQALDIMHMQEYMLQVKATDYGNPPLSSQIPVHIIVVMSENDPPRFTLATSVIEMLENLQIGSFITHIEARSSSSVFYNIVEGNDGGYFYINPSTGVVLVNSKIDYEQIKQFNLTIKGTNMASVSSYHNIIIHVLDVNDNPPYFTQIEYFGQISEASEPGSYVNSNNSINSLLYLKAHDADVGQNSNLEYTIMDAVSNQYFQIDFLTGNIQLLQKLDYELIKEFTFNVMVNDKGSPKLYSRSLAHVTIYVVNVNDCPPIFEMQEMNATLYLPSYEGIGVLKVTATDMDKDINNKIRYDIVEGNLNNTFQIDNSTGMITTRNINTLVPCYTLHIRASDGIFSTISQVEIHTAVINETGFQFQKKRYKFSSVENSSKIVVVGVVTTIGTFLDENVEYKILNPTNLFEIGKTSGAIKTTGVIFDRESVDVYTLIIEAMSILYNNNQPYLRRATTLVDVSILDTNDNCPIFVNLPYYSTVSLEDTKGSVIMKVKAIDLDSYENGEVRYEMKRGNGELFKVDRKTGDIILRQKIENDNKKYELVVAAYDNALTPCSSEVTVTIKIVDRSMPVFNKQFYFGRVKEDVELFSALSVNIQAESPLERNLIYTISNEDFFEIDYRTGMLYVVNTLDFEMQKSHELIVRATDIVSGVFAEVTLSIGVEDANDCYPHIETDNYNITLPENLPLGSQVLKINASDCDSDANSVLSFHIDATNGDRDSELFYIDVADGSIYLKHQLNYEECKSYLLIIKVKDHGTPSLTSRANVWIKVKDLNDNIPKFVEPSFSSKLSVNASRGQFVTRASAYDDDECDSGKLKYKIVDGNDYQIYNIEESTGIIVLQNNQRLESYKQSILNISVTDGLHISFARVKINLLPENMHSPIFESSVYEVHVNENEKQNTLILTVKAIDHDFGKYGSIYYDIPCNDMASIFRIDNMTGSIYSKIPLDREQRQLYEILVKATDGGGKFSYSFVRLKVDDVNDNVPYFQLNEYKLILKDDIAINTVVAQITAVDLDTGRNAQLNYSIENVTDNGSWLKNIVLKSNGEIVILKSLKLLTNRLIQFFVRVIDDGYPDRHSNLIPVSLQIMESNVTIPYFEKKSMNINVDETLNPGSILARLKVTGNYSVKFSLASKSSKFTVSENGDVLLTQSLDRELSPLEHITAMFETATKPVLYGYIDIYINIQDDNDNFPTFSNLVYNMDVPENNEKGSSILKITAFDPDEGPNGDVRYYLDDDDLDKMFEIDIHSGWITQLGTLDRELQSEYYFNVLASDNGQSKQTSKVTVSIAVRDYNDNPPLFKQTFQMFSVPENALPGTVLNQLLISDLDSEKNNLQFFIVSGDNKSQFQIANTGELFVSKALDRESISSYSISVAVTDGKFVSYTDVSINVLDINDNFPICISPKYEIAIPESTPVSASIVKINAIDIDDVENSRIRFYVTGNYSEDFYVDKDQGILRVAEPIDREIRSKYSLLVHVQDAKELLQECICEVIITVTDVNDNRPEFSMHQYILSIPENAQIGTIVTKIHAVDRDFGLNRKISYTLLDETEYFEIYSSSGIIKLKKLLDRESISVFNLTVKAEDNGTSKLYSTENLIVHVLDINDNPPEFQLKQYKAYLWENATVDTQVTQVYATSKDIGVNAEISYYIIGGNEQQKFKIDTTSGIIFLNMEIDYEKTKSFFLNVQAIDGGIPPLSSQTFVNITVLDVNDNTPHFSQNLYRVKVSERANIGDNILQVIAMDDDSDKNGVVEYNIERGDRLKQFSIDDFSGKIYVNHNLDREGIQSYILEVRACDKGWPRLCSFVQVFVDIMDVNDNSPIVRNGNSTILLQENKPLGFEVTTFDVSDADEYPNTSPYTFDFRSGNEGGFFRLEQDGRLLTAFRFSHRICDEYILQIRVFDNGIPPLYSDTWVTIKIIEESQYPPIITPLEITINSVEDDFGGGFLGKVYVSDQDKYDTFTYKIEANMTQTYSAIKLFNISATTGDIYAITNLDIGLYYINVSVSDGKFNSFANVRINVELVTTEMIKNAVIMRFSKITAKDFILSHRKAFLRIMREVLQCRQKDIFIIALKENDFTNTKHIFKNSSSNLTVTNSNHMLDVAFAIKKQLILPTSESYYTPEEVLYKMSIGVEEIEIRSNLPIEDIVSNECPVNICVHGKCNTQMFINKNEVNTFYTDVVSYVTPEYKLNYNCACKQGFDGKNCEEPVNACSSDPCPPQKQCWPADTINGYQCICPSGYAGQFCEVQSSRCHYNNCSNLQTSVSFSGKSYAHYKINKSSARHLVESQFSLTLRIRTVQQSGTLVYASGQIDYSIIEIVNGVVQYRFDLGSGEGVVAVTSINISDGEWHSIKLERVLNTAKLVVDNKHTSQSNSPGINSILNLDKNEIFVGAKVIPHHTIVGYEDIQRGFIGCLADIKVGHETLPLHIVAGGNTVAALRFTNVEFLCDPSKVLINLGICGEQPCLNSGICHDLGDNFQCVCSERYAGRFCEIDLDPCASIPCLYGGLCEMLGPNNYSCTCPSHLSGKRCEYGRFCIPNPCKNGGICEEGDGVSHCMCRGFTGPTCEIDVDECENQPCGSGATCINEAGSFRCICPSYLTGASCGDPLYSNSISTKLRNLSVEKITGIICGALFVFILCTITICCRMYRRNCSTRKKSSSRIKNSCKETKLNSLLEKEKNNKHKTKISNLEVNHRPLSYAPTATDNMISSTHFVNNLDILRSYGSAGDELENIPFEYQKISINKVNVNINNENISEAAVSAYKTDWCDQTQLKTFCESKLNNGKCVDYNLPLNRLTSTKSSCTKLIHVAMPNVCQPTYGADYSNHGQYHWDCSDWARNSQNPLPDITEVPGAEIVDSSSFHSNESNESKPKDHAHAIMRPDPRRDTLTVNEELVVNSQVQDSIPKPNLPFGSNSRLSPAYYSENEDYTSNSGKLYVRHPDSYLPPLNNLSETDGETNPQCYNFKCQADVEDEKRKLSVNSDDEYFCPKSPYGSNRSVHLCEIEDSELEEFLPKRQVEVSDD